MTTAHALRMRMTENENTVNRQGLSHGEIATWRAPPTTLFLAPQRYTQVGGTTCTQTPRIGGRRVQLPRYTPRHCFTDTQPNMPPNRP